MDVLSVLKKKQWYSKANWTPQSITVRCLVLQAIKHTVIEMEMSLSAFCLSPVGSSKPLPISIQLNSFGVCIYAPLPLCPCSSMPLFLYAPLPLCPSSSMLLFLYAPLPLYPYAPMPICNYAPMPLCPYLCLFAHLLLCLCGPCCTLHNLVQIYIPFRGPFTLPCPYKTNNITPEQVIIKQSQNVQLYLFQLSHLANQLKRTQCIHNKNIRSKFRTVIIIIIIIIIIIKQYQESAQ